MNIPIILNELAKVGVVALTEKSIETFVETKIKPIFENWGKEESRSIELEECLSEYLLRCYGKNNIMTTIVFGKQQKTLEDLYIPLTLEEYRNEDKKWVIDEKCYDVLDNYSRILIIDMAGMGKSTIVKYFACQGVNLDKCIPIVIELRRLEKDQSIIEYIQTQINSLDKNIEVEEVVNMLKKGDFVVFFDGYDEVANENKPNVLDAIQEFTDKANKTKIVITSREEDDLNSLGEYKCVNIKPLTEEEAYELIKKYDNDGDISKKLIKRLKEDSSMDVLKEFLENPLLVSLLYKTFEYKEEIPYKKIDFYEQVYAALFNDHDKTKGSAYVHEKRTKLDKFEFEQILRAFAFLCLKTDKVEYSDQLIHQLLGQAIGRFSWLKISVDNFLYDITHAVPFIHKEGNEYKWVHKSFMEYFASCFICYDNKEFEQKYLEKMISSDNPIKYFNILDFCFEMDTIGFRKYVILPCLEKYIDKYDNSFNASYFQQFNEEDLRLAKGILAATECVILSNNVIDSTSHKKFDSILEIASEPSLSIYTKYTDYVLKMILKKRELKLFEETHYNNFNRNGLFIGDNSEFNDNINNAINSDKNKFHNIVNIINLAIKGSYKYEECRRLIEEIRNESDKNNIGIFDL